MSMIFNEECTRYLAIHKFMWPHFVQNFYYLLFPCWDFVWYFVTNKSMISEAVPFSW